MSDWIEWKDGECPVDGDAIVDVRFGDGTADSDSSAFLYHWGVSEFVRGEDVVVAYRLHIDPRIQRLMDACEGELEGLSITEEQARLILAHVDGTD